MNIWQLQQSQNLPLDAKIVKTQLRIREWYEHYDGQVYISFSGGKDSTVLLHLVRELYPEVPAVFCDTGLEYPEIREFVKTIDNVVWLRPKKTFREVIEDYGYPVVSKEQSEYLQQYRESNSEKLKQIRWEGNKSGRGKISKKWRYLSEAPFKISNRCCFVMKKYPAKAYEKETGLKVMTGEMTEESQLRKQKYLKSGGCNDWGAKRPKSTPMAFWTEQDVLQYLKLYELPYSSVYGEIIEIDGKLRCTKCQRTGCMFCLYGVHLEDEPNRFQRMKETHPEIYSYCMNKLGLKKVLEYLNVPFE